MKKPFFITLLTAIFLFSSSIYSAEETPSPTASPTPSPPVVIIVNPANPVKELSVQQLADFYLKKSRYWPDGSKVRFFDQRNSSPAKLWFIQKITKKTQRDLDLFWIGEKNYNGQGAPVVAPSDDMVISSVAALPGAIGYVNAADADLSEVKKIDIKGLE